jgi:hypothetical protein
MCDAHFLEQGGWLNKFVSPCYLPLIMLSSGPTPEPTPGPSPGPTYGPSPGPTPGPTNGPTPGPTPGPTSGQPLGRRLDRPLDRRLGPPLDPPLVPPPSSRCNSCKGSGRASSSTGWATLNQMVRTLSGWASRLARGLLNKACQSFLRGRVGGH